MIELELMLKELERLYAKEKSLRRKLMLENAMNGLKDFQSDEARQRGI